MIDSHHSSRLAITVSASECFASNAPTRTSDGENDVSYALHQNSAGRFRRTANTTVLLTPVAL